MADQDRPKTATEDEILKAVDIAEEKSNAEQAREEEAKAALAQDSAFGPSVSEPLKTDPTLDLPPPPATPDPVNPSPYAPAPGLSDAQKAPAKKSGGGFLGTVLGGVIAAGAGYALAVYAPIPGLPMASPQLDPAQVQSQLQSLSDRIGTLENAPAPAAGGDPQREAELDGRFAALEQRLNDLPATSETAAPAAVDPALAGQLSQAQEALAALQDRLAALEARPAPSGIASLSPDVTQEIEALRAGIEAKATETEARLTAALDAAQAQAAELQSQAQAAAQKAVSLAAVGRLQAALDTGAPFTAVIADLQGVELPAALSAQAESGVPSLQALELSFPPAAREALSAALHADMGATWGERIGSFLQSATSARSLAPREGNDPDAILSRAEAALKAADLKQALAEIATLPEPGQAAMGAWTAQAQQRIEALEAAATLAAAVEG